MGLYFGQFGVEYEAGMTQGRGGGAASKASVQLPCHTSQLRRLPHLLSRTIEALNIDITRASNQPRTVNVVNLSSRVNETVLP